MMLLELGLVFFVLLGSKILLGCVAVYMLLPQASSCEICDGALLPIVAHPAAAPALRLFRLERRWCMQCRRETLARVPGSALRRFRTLRPIPQSRVR